MDMNDPTHDSSYDPFDDVSLEARKWATVCHISALIGLLGNGVGFVIGPLIVWLLQRHEDPYIDAQGKAAVNFQLTCMLAVICCVLLFFLVLPLLLLIPIGLCMVIFSIVGATKANAGEPYEYPFSIWFVK